jgi:hypothetical protein
VASADELRELIEAGQGELRRAIEGAGASWERSPGGEEWSPRQIAEHAVGAALTFVAAVAGVLGQPSPPLRDLSFTSAEEALAALSRVDDASALYGRVQDADLEQPAPFMDNLAGVMGLAGTHASEHAGQIGRSP